MIQAFEGTFGAHQGQRRNHIKGTCAAGEFVGTSDAAALSRSPLFTGQADPGGRALFARRRQSADVPDAAPAPRGMGLEFRIPGGAIQHITMIDLPIFGAMSPASFRDAIVAAKPDPKTGQPDPEKLKAYAASHPDSMALSKYSERAQPDRQLLPEHLLQRSHLQVHRRERRRASGDDGASCRAMARRK